MNLRLTQKKLTTCRHTMFTMAIKRLYNRWKIFFQKKKSIFIYNETPMLWKMFLMQKKHPEK